VVGIGASAGGFDALVEFLQVMPANSGLAFIILQHLSPSPRSLSAELFSRHTAMSVRPAQDGVRLQANCVYTTPAERDIRLKDGRICLSKPTEARGRRLPVDQLFRSLGQDRRERAIGIILSGTGSDGALGLKEIVANGGIVLVQAPESAQFDGMPRSAMATGMVAYVLPIAKMPRVLLSYARHAYVRKPATLPSGTRFENPLSKILALVEAGHGQSFSGYKQAMVVRRIERRMGLLNIETLDEYAKYLRRNADEVMSLRKDLLIGVTEFFRDREAWKALDADVLRPLIASKKPGQPIRAWVAGVGTGEEAYTLAILILARQRRLRKRCLVQIFGTDANQESLNYARAGRYPLGIRGQIPVEHFKRYFQESNDDHHYKVTSEVRESVIFGDHDLLADPPFSRLDLVTCRNLLIYIEPEMQNRILLRCHFALRPNGYLFLGSAETVGAHEKLFRSVARKSHIYQRIGTTPRDQIHWRADKASPPASALAREPLSDAGRVAQLANLTHNALFERFAPAAVLVNERMETLYSTGPVERSLLPSRTSTNKSLVPRLPKDIRAQLPTAIRRAQAARRSVLISGVAQGSKPDGTTLHVEVLPIPSESGRSGDPRYLITFQEFRLGKTVAKSRTAHSELREELRATQEDLQSVVSQLKTSNEELRASHEETMSINEELQSMNEELESSKEELQSVNEELNTVNTQLQHKVGELEVANSNLRNLLASNEVATLCLDRSFRIEWFTPAAHRLFNLLPSDIGRPIADLSLATMDPSLIDHSRAVLQTKTPCSREMEYKGVYLRRIVPYRSAEGPAVAGVVITFVDITEAKRAAQKEIEAKAAANQRLEERVRERTEELGRLSHELALAEVRERQTIARDLHDGLGQELNAASIKLDALRNADEASRSDAALDEIAKLLEGVVREMRSLTAQLNPPVLEQLGLLPAIEWLSEEMRKTYQLEIVLDDDLELKPLDTITASIMFRAVRELLINVTRHAKVKMAQVATRCADGRLTIKVIDQGIGFSVNNAQSTGPVGLGLATIRERITYIGGTLHIDSSQNRGTTATIQVPMHRP
jgi:chemotaxis methyl-accepting protein methylase/signal transduction histidine kinase/flagellar motor switch/type III secretory pathway protein FliN